MKFLPLKLTEKQDKKITWMVFSVLSFLPWFIASNTTNCTGELNLAVDCFTPQGWFFGGVLTTASLVCLFALRYKKNSRWFWYLLAQVIGLAGLGFFQSWQVGVWYAIVLTIILAYNNKASRSLTASPIYIAWFALLLAAAVFSKSEVVSRLLEVVSSIPFPMSFGGVVALICMPISLFFINLWTKKHSFLVYFFSVIYTVALWIFLLAYFTASNFGW